MQTDTAGNLSGGYSSPGVGATISKFDLEKARNCSISALLYPRQGPALVIPMEYKKGLAKRREAFPSGLSCTSLHSQTEQIQ